MSVNYQEGPDKMTSLTHAFEGVWIIVRCGCQQYIPVSTGKKSI